MFSRQKPISHKRKEPLPKALRGTSVNGRTRTVDQRSVRNSRETHVEPVMLCGVVFFFHEPRVDVLGVCTKKLQGPSQGGAQSVLGSEGCGVFHIILGEAFIHQTWHHRTCAVGSIDRKNCHFTLLSQSHIVFCEAQMREWPTFNRLSVKLTSGSPLASMRRKMSKITVKLAES